MTPKINKISFCLLSELLLYNLRKVGFWKISSDTPPDRYRDFTCMCTRVSVPQTSDKPPGPFQIMDSRLWTSTSNRTALAEVCDTSCDERRPRARTVATDLSLLLSLLRCSLLYCVAKFCDLNSPLSPRRIMRLLIRSTDILLYLETYCEPIPIYTCVVPFGQLFLLSSQLYLF